MKQNKKPRQISLLSEGCKFLTSEVLLNSIITIGGTASSCFGISPFLFLQLFNNGKLLDFFLISCIFSNYSSLIQCWLTYIVSFSICVLAPLGRQTGLFQEGHDIEDMYEWTEVSFISRGVESRKECREILCSSAQNIASLICNINYCAAIWCMLVAGKFVKFCLKNCSAQTTVFSSILFSLCQQQPF